MRKLLRGERAGQVAVVAVVLLSATGVLLAWTYVKQDRDFKKTIYDRCVTRLQYDQANHRSIGADVALYRQLLAQNAKVPESAIPPDLRALAREQRHTIEMALAEKERAFAGGIPGDCDELK